MNNLGKIKEKIEELALKINAPSRLLPGFGRQDFDSQYFIVVDPSEKMCYIRVERGKEFERRETFNMDELLFWVFDSVTFWMASEFGIEHARPDEDYRRVRFKKHEELMGLINLKWQGIIEERNKISLLVNPFDDNIHLRGACFRQLRDEGLPESEITKLAFEKYPVINRYS